MATEDYLELLANTLSGDGYIKLQDGFVSVQGVDSKKFLQGQVSCDVESLDTEQPRYGSASTPKGRLYSIFQITPWKDGYLLKLHESMVDTLISTLSKYAVFFKCEVSEEPTVVAYGGLKATIPKLKQHPSDTFITAPLSKDSELYEIWMEPLPESSQDLTECTNWSVIKSVYGIPELRPEISESFVLQQLNLQQLNAVSFKKGCYTGQEIIARMKFLGKLKKKMYLIQSEKTGFDQLPDLGSGVTDANKKKQGELVNLSAFTKSDGSIIGHVGLAVLNIDFVQNGKEVFLDGADEIPFKVEEIAY